VHEDIFIRCVNPVCPGKIIEMLKFFVSKNAMDIEFVGPELIQRLHDAGKLNRISDLYAVTKEDLLSLDRMGDLLADKILVSIDGRRRIPLFLFLRAMGIRTVGDHLAKVLSKRVGSLNRFFSISADELTAINDVGPGVAEAVVEFFNDRSVRSMIADMQKNGVVVEDELPVASEGPFMGKTFVFTGSLVRSTREESESLVEKLGGRAASSVSKKTDFLIAGGNAGSKLDKARTLGVTVLTEDEFFAMVEGTHE
jgi:DNA ligase (NAD+)